MKAYVENSEEVNSRFNEDLQRQIAGTLLSKEKPHYTYELGRPSEILRFAGIPDLPIELNAATLIQKSSPDYKNSHPFELSDIKDLPKAIQNPIMVFDSKTRADSIVILTELKSKRVNFVVAMEIYHKKGSNRTGVIETNSIRSLYPKDQINDILDWLKSGLLKYVDKEKASAFMKELRSQFPQKSFKNVEAYMHNIINNFEKSKGLAKLFI